MMHPIRTFAFFLFVLLAQFAFAWNAPSISSPANGSDTWVGVTLNWNSVSGSQFYQVQIDTTPQFNSTLFYSATKAYINSVSSNSDTQENPPALRFGQNYYWRVRAYITGDTSAWTNSTFVTRDYVNQSSPAIGSDVWAGTTLNWAPHTGVQFYQVQADTSALFNSPALRVQTNGYINSTDGNSDTQYFLSDIYFGTTYHWRVRAINAVDTTAWSPVWTFVTRDYVNQTTPSSGSDVWAGTTLNWAPHTGVQFYQVQADTSAAFNSPALRVQTNGYINSTDGNSDTQYFLSDIYFGTTYHWRVRAINAVDTTAWSPVWTFVTRDYVTQSSPASGSDVWAGTTLNWTPHTGVQFYQVQADTSTAFNSSALRVQTNGYINSTDGNSDTQYFLSDIYFGTTYHWRVRAINAVDTTTWSPVWTFVTRNYVNQTTPSSGSDVWAGTTLNWAPHTGVQFYQVQADTSAAFNSPTLRVQTNGYINSTDGNSDTQYFLSDIYFGTTYHWRVRAINAVDTTTWSPVWTFLTRDYVTLSSPANAAANTTLNPTLNWTPHTGVGSYTLQVDVSNLFNTGSLQTFQKAYINSTDGNSDTQQGISGLAANTVYFWRVRANNALDSSAWTTRWFSTGTATPVFPGIPSLVSGQCGITQVDAQAHNLNWNAVAEADFYQLELRLFGQLDGTPTVSTINGTSYTTANLLEGITYQWRVRAVDGSLVSDWSTACTFTTQAAVSISAPVVDEEQYCAGDALSFNSLTSNNFGASNVFTVFLSNANGDFSFPPPTALGTFTNEGVSVQTLSLPENASGSSNYKLRISSTDPQFTGAPSSSFSINALPELEGDLSLLVCAQSGIVDLPVILPEGGIYEGSGVSGNAFNPALTGPGLIDLSYTYTNTAGCSSTLLGTAQVETCTSVEVPSAVLNGSFLITNGNFSVDVFDLQGKLVARSQCINTVIDLNTLVLRDGVYLILISDGTTSIGKIAALNKQK
jgi:hypothetical protein